MNISAWKDSGSWSRRPTAALVPLGELRAGQLYPMSGYSSNDVIDGTPEDVVTFIFRSRGGASPPPVICCVQLYYGEGGEVTVDKNSGVDADDKGHKGKSNIAGRTSAALYIERDDTNEHWLTFSGLSGRTWMYQVWLEDPDPGDTIPDTSTLATVDFEIWV